MPSPPISVILPARDAQAHVGQAVRSVLAQTMADFEIVLVDDGSCDATVPAALSAARGDARLRIIANRGRGLVAALQTGLAAARAQIIARMDADDVAHPQRFARQFAFLAAHPQIDLVGSQVAFIDEHGRALGDISHFPTEPAEIAKALFEKGCVIRQPTVMMRRAALEAAGAYRAITEGAEDYDLWLRMAERGRLANLPDVLLDYRRHPGQISHGVNWRQSFGRDCALIAARGRRRGEPDPLAGWDRRIELAPEAAADPRCTPEIRRLVEAYVAARGLLEGNPLALESRTASLIMETARAGLFGENRHFRTRILVALARASWTGHRLPIAWSAFAGAMALSPGRAIRALAS